MSSAQEKEKYSGTFGLWILLLLGVLDSIYLVFHHVEVKGGFLSGDSFCNIGGVFNCDEVARSVYAEILGIPIASLGLFYYLVFFALLIFSTGKNLDEPERLNYENILFVFALFSLPATFSFAYLSLFRLNYICIFCSLLYLLNIGLCLSTWRASKQQAGFRSRVFDGLISLTRLVFPLTIGRWRYAFFVWSAILVAGLASYLLPIFIATQYFEPRELRRQDPRFVAMFIEKWRNGIVQPVEVRDSGSYLEKDFSLGNPQGALTIVEFFDYQCPACRDSARILEKLVKNSDGAVRVVMKHFPLNSSCNRAVEGDKHSYSCRAALMARCAGAEGDEAFLRMHRALFELAFFEWEQETLDSLPGKLGLNTIRFNQCLGDSAAILRVKQDVELAIKLGVSSTPTMFVKGKKLYLDRHETLPAIINGILHQMRQN